VLAERRQQHAAHLGAAAHRPGNGRGRAARGARRLLQERQAANEEATRLRLALAQDDARRHGAQAMLAQIEAQAAIEQRWAAWMT
jgi:exonuclease SbcC